MKNKEVYKVWRSRNHQRGKYRGDPSVRNKCKFHQRRAHQIWKRRQVPSQSAVHRAWWWRAPNAYQAQRHGDFHELHGEQEIQIHIRNKDGQAEHHLDNSRAEEGPSNQPMDHHVHENRQKSSGEHGAATWQPSRAVVVKHLIFSLDWTVLNKDISIN